MTRCAITLHGTPLSGHCHRVEQLLLSLGLPYTYRDAPADVRATAEFKKLNGLGQIPVLTDGDVVLADSVAIMVYLVKKYAPDSHWLPAEPVAAAEVQRWLSLAAGEVRFGPALARADTLWGDGSRAPGALKIAERLLAFMNQHLERREWLVGSGPTLADLACYAYVAHAPEGGAALAPYPAVEAWIARVEKLPRFKPMPRSPARTAA
jgi:glutathione S-transferase